MNTGMLWFDDDPNRTLTYKVERAAVRFIEKYGVWPDLCYANPNTSPNIEQVIALPNKHVLTLKQAKSVQPNHFWLGVSGE